MPFGGKDVLYLLIFKRRHKLMNVTIETLSPIHIGSGIQYQGNAEYLFFEKENVLVVADEAKILDIIGNGNIHIWVGYIEDKDNKKNFIEYLRTRKPGLQPSDIARRIIPLKGGKRPYFTNTLREQIHGGMGVPYIPGSSLKGSIRTALFSDTLIKAYAQNGVPEVKLGSENRFSGKFNINDKPLQKEVFGQDPNSDWLRMLQVGDCYFKAGTHGAFAETLNEKGNQQEYEVKGEVRQLIEYIPAGKTATCAINIPTKHRDLILRKDPQLFRTAVRQLDYAWLCQLIHAHTLRLLREEIAFFQDADLPEAGADLPEFMQDLLKQATAFPENTCLLRLGFGTGYRNMTGDWVKDLVKNDDLYDDIANATRRTPRYNGMPLPKSRKIMFEGDLMGYVKLSFPV